MLLQLFLVYYCLRSLLGLLLDARRSFSINRSYLLLTFLFISLSLFSAFWMNPFYDLELAPMPMHEPIMGWPDVDHVSTTGVWSNPQRLREGKKRRVLQRQIKECH